MLNELLKKIRIIPWKWWGIKSNVLNSMLDLIETRISGIPEIIFDAYIIKRIDTRIFESKNPIKILANFEIDLLKFERIYQ